MKRRLNTHCGEHRSPLTTLAGMPVQTVAAAGVAATIELEPSYTAPAAERTR